MFNKLYDIVKKYIKANYKFLIGLLIFYFIFNIPVPYYIYNGGGTIDISDRIKIKDDENEQNFFMCYVGQMKANIMTLGLSYIFPNIDRDKINNSQYNEEDEKLINDIMLKESKSNAIINAFTKSGENINIGKEQLYVTHIYEEANTNLQIGDEILSINDKNFDSFDKFKELISNSSKNSEIYLHVKDKNNKEKTRKAKIIEINKELKIGIGITVNYNYEISSDIDIKFKKNESGPSGGLMMSLAIYDKLTNSELSSDKNVCGTGTISKDGEIGEIGGVKYKLNGAVKNKCDIFLVPSGENYKEAIEEKNKNDYDIDIYEAKDFLGVVNYLKNS